ncbi:hypothetical protein QQ045_030861 [Rhodiola kirilowii]
MLSQWNKNSFGDIRVKLCKARDEWERLGLLQDERSLSEEENLRKLALQKIIWLLEVQDERTWRQKSRINWLRLGDQNTKYFHRMAIWRAKRNGISGLSIGEKWVTEPSQIKQAARGYFSGIYKRSEPCSWSLEELNFGSLSEDQRSLLESNITAEEIQMALKQCDGNKAPGPDGFNMNFYKKYWIIVGGEVEEFIKEFCTNGRLTRGINKTYLALIPKTANPQGFADYRPISLVNSSYKILSKCLAKRLSSVLPQIVSPNQSAFIAERNILDGIMIVNELIHAVKREKRVALVIKLDFRKAYDSVSWEYLRSVQSSMGFGTRWMNWIEESYSSVELAILINGSPTKGISMGRGLRQGDPLSPFLFLLAAEGLSRMLNNTVRSGMISGAEWVQNGGKLTHLQFADDTILFCKADIQEVRKIRIILNSFAVCSGLEVNLSKSRCLGVGLEEEEVQNFADLLGCPAGSFPMNYLGMQVGGNPGRIATWRPILQKFKLKLASWRSVNLSMAGRVVLIKSALCNLPLYYASMYKIPLSVAQEMEKIQRRFLWGSSELRRKIHYVKWSRITKPGRMEGWGSKAWWTRTWSFWPSGGGSSSPVMVVYGEGWCWRNTQLGGCMIQKRLQSQLTSFPKAGRISYKAYKGTQRWLRHLEKASN